MPELAPLIDDVPVQNGPGPVPGRTANMREAAWEHGLLGRCGRQVGTWYPRAGPHRHLGPGAARAKLGQWIPTLQSGRRGARSHRDRLFRVISTVARSVAVSLSCWNSDDRTSRGVFSCRLPASLRAGLFRSTRLMHDHAHGPTPPALGLQVCRPVGPQPARPSDAP